MQGIRRLRGDECPLLGSSAYSPEAAKAAVRAVGGQYDFRDGVTNMYLDLPGMSFSLEPTSPSEPQPRAWEGLICR